MIADTGWVDSYNVVRIHFEVDDHNKVLVGLLAVMICTCLNRTRTPRGNKIYVTIVYWSIYGCNYSKNWLELPVKSPERIRFYIPRSSQTKLSKSY